MITPRGNFLQGSKRSFNCETICWTFYSFGCDCDINFYCRFGINTVFGIEKCFRVISCRVIYFQNFSTLFKTGKKLLKFQKSDRIYETDCTRDNRNLIWYSYGTINLFSKFIRINYCKFKNQLEACTYHEFQGR